MNKFYRTGAQTAAATFASLRRGLVLCGFTAVLASAASTSIFAQATVKTLGGGRLTSTGSDAGFADGNILQLSQFNTPFGCAADANGHLYVADRNNGALRRLDLAASRCRTLFTGFQQPVAVAIDRTNIVYVLSEGDGTIQKIDRGIASLFSTGLSAPTAMAYDGSNSLFVAQSDGAVVQVSLKDGSLAPTLLHGLNNPGGIAVLDSGFIAVSETGSHMVRIWDPQNGAVKLQVGSGTSGFAEGPADHARFNQPYQIAKTPAGSLIVADRGNHRVRLIDVDGFVTTVYGIDPKLWEGPACTSCDPIILPGWLDGSSEDAEAREPVGVAVAADGTIYTTEVFYHLVRQVTGAPLTGVSNPGTGGGTNNTVVVLPPMISPASGYYPMGQTITVTDPNFNNLLPASVYYTVDGTDPTTNSLRVTFSGNTGTIFWQDKQHDLTALRLKTFLGSNGSVIVGGQPVDATEIGVPQDIIAGMGSTAIIPVVVNLRTNDRLQSIQFRVEMTPETAGTPVLPESVRLLSISTNDFIPLFTAETKGVATFTASAYSFDRTRGFAVAFIGTNANLLVKNFAVMAMLAIPVPADAKQGDRYKIEVLNPSGTADAGEQRVEMVSMPARSIIVAQTHYLVGDSSPSTWYNSIAADLSGETRKGFGDGLLDNSDVNNAFAAALGLRVPYANSDLFDALDAFPEDTANAVGGDGVIRFLDWQVILERSLGLNSGHWERGWTEGGLQVLQTNASLAVADSPGQSQTAPPPGSVWIKQVQLGAQSVEQAVPGVAFDVPVYVRVTPGNQLAGLAFRAMVEPDGAAPALAAPLQFIPNPDMPAPPQNSAPGPNILLCGWPIVPSSSFDPPLRGSNVVGYVRVTLPITAHAGQSYTMRFANADGSPDLQTQYDFETTPGSIWVLSPALRPPPSTSEEWKAHFFGSLTDSSSADDADPDHDGVPNWAEFLAGTDPTNGQSFLHLVPQVLDSARKAVTLRWLSAPGKVYRIESSSTLLNPQWSVLATGLAGDGRLQEWTQNNLTSQTQFYRIALQP